MVIVPGTLGAMEFSALAAEFGVSGITVGEVDTAPHVCRRRPRRGALYEEKLQVSYWEFCPLARQMTLLMKYVPYFRALFLIKMSWNAGYLL